MNKNTQRMILVDSLGNLLMTEDKEKTKENIKKLPIHKRLFCLFSKYHRSKYISVRGFKVELKNKTNE